MLLFSNSWVLMPRWQSNAMNVKNISLHTTAASIRNTRQNAVKTHAYLPCAGRQFPIRQLGVQHHLIFSLTLSFISFINLYFIALQVKVIARRTQLVNTVKYKLVGRTWGNMSCKNQKSDNHVMTTAVLHVRGTKIANSEPDVFTCDLYQTRS